MQLIFYHLTSQMALPMDPAFLFNIYKHLSIPNRNLIRLLSVYNSDNYFRIHLNIKNLFHNFYRLPIDCNSFDCVLNYFVTSYLKSVVDKSLRPCVLKHYQLCYPVNTKCVLTEKIMKELHGCILYNFQAMHKIYKDMMVVEIPVERVVTKSENDMVRKKNDFRSKTQTSFTDKGFQSFLLPLEQDYTKSSKGYNSHLMTISDVSKDLSTDVLYENKYLLKKSELSYEEANQTQKNTSPQHSNASKKTVDDENSNYDTIYCSDSISYIQNIDNSIHHQKLSQSICLRNEDSKIILSEAVSIDQILQQLDSFTINKNPYEAILSSEDFLNKSFSKENSHSDSDSDDFIVFSENVDAVQEDCGMSIKNLLDFQGTFDDSEDEENKWVEECDEEDSDLYETFNLSFNGSHYLYPRTSSCLQNKIYIGNEPVDTYAYVNACFKDDEEWINFSQITSVNNVWNKAMKDVSSEPREPKRVSFMAFPDLVSVQRFEPDNDGYRYSLSVLDKVHFQNRIQEFETILAPYLTLEHRTKVYQQNNE